MTHFHITLNSLFNCSVQAWLLWLCQIEHSCQLYFKGQWANWNWNPYSQFGDTKGQCVYLPQVAYYLPLSEICLYGLQVFRQNCGRTYIWKQITFILVSLSPMIQLFKILCALKLKTRSMAFLWMEVSILLDIIIFLMPFLAKLILPNTPVFMRSLTIPGSTVLVLLLPSMPLLLNLWKNSSNSIGSLGSSYNISNSLCNLF